MRELPGRIQLGRQPYLLVLLVAAVSILAAGCGGLSGPALPTRAPTLAPAITLPAEPSPPAPTETPPQAGTLVPIPETSEPMRPLPPVGVEWRGTVAGPELQLLEQASARLVRHNGVLWSQVEPAEGQRNWEALAELEGKLVAFSEAGAEVILIVRSTPAWAQAVPGVECGPIRSDKLAAFAAFMADLVGRYSAPPYNVKYWELWNEPDVDPAYVKPRSVFGCWGDEDDAFYGGGYYAAMLRAVTPIIRAVAPGSQVLIGGLLLDCDPTNPPEDRACREALFLEGILQSGGASYFDIVSFHGYAPFSGGKILDRDFPSWQARGGVVLGKVSYLRELLARNGVAKPLFHTEGGMICPDWSRFCQPAGDFFFEAQADYVVWMFVRNWASNIEGSIWYSFEDEGWRYGGMLGSPEAPKPAYRAFRYLTSKLNEASYLGPLEGYPDVEGYAFLNGQGQTWVVWSPDQENHVIQLPPGVLGVTDKYGNPVEPAGDLLLINSPVYIDLSQ